MRNECSFKDRLYSLDFLRGLDMVFLTVLGPLVWAVDAACGLPQGLLYQFTHPWEGFTAWDIIMPLFLFMCGAAIPFSIEKRLVQNGGRPDGAYWRHVAWRVVMLWTLGMVVQGHLLDFDLLAIRPYNNTLQTIAAGYLAMAVLILLPFKWRIVVPAAGFVAYGLIVHFCGDYTMTGNAAERVEQAVLSTLLPANSQAIRELGPLGYLGRLSEIGEIHYTWILTTPMFVFMTACGYHATKIICSQAPDKVRLMRLAVFGGALLAFGWILAFCGVKMVKHIFAVSFTAQAMGWSVLLLAAAYLLVDMWKLRRGTAWIVLCGRTSLVAYMIGEFFWPCYMFTGKFLTKGLVHITCEPMQGVIACAVAIALLFGSLVIRRRIK
jgi:predicted acyltransferase